MEGSRIKNFPISFFAVIMGLTGLAIAYMRLSFIDEFLRNSGIFLTYFSTSLFGLFFNCIYNKII